jgi:hypothetical protein
MNVSTTRGLSGSKATAVEADRSAMAPWVRPELRRLAAGSAEDSFGPSTDAITNPS